MLNRWDSKVTPNQRLIEVYMSHWMRDDLDLFLFDALNTGGNNSLVSTDE